MFISTILSFSLLAMPQQFSVKKMDNSPREVVQFDGAVIEITGRSLKEIPEGEFIVLEDFPLGNEASVKLKLQRFEVFTEDAQVVIGSVGKDGGIINRAIDRPNVALFKGTIEGDPSSLVFLAVGKHTTNGLVETDGKTFVIAKDKTHGWTVVYNLSNVDPEDMNWADFQCGVEEASQPLMDSNQNDFVGERGDCQALQIAVDTDWEFTGDLFEGNTAASSEYATTLMAAMSSIYMTNINTGIQISYLRLWDTSSDPWSSSSTGSQLPQFRAHWQDNMSSVSRHLAHMLSGRQLGGGIAYVGAVCTSYGYAVSANLRGTFPNPLESYNQNNWDIMVVSHETGHNCGTWHTHNYEPVIDGCGLGDCSDAYGGTIMSYCHLCSGGMTNIVLNFDSRVRDTMSNYLALDVPCSLACDASVVGACCSEEGCISATNADCENVGGNFLGTGTTCEIASCDPQVGACCIDSSCSEQNRTNCLNSGGVFISLGSSCSDGWCDEGALNACCIGDTCSDLTSSECDVAGGFFAGIGTSCVLGGCAPLTNDFCNTARSVTSGVHNFTNYGALTDDDEYGNEFCSTEYLGGMNSDVWFTYNACENGLLLVSTCNIVNFDSDIVVYEGTCEDKVQVECNGDGEGCGSYTSEVALDVYTGESYLIRVGGFSENSIGNGQILIGGQQCNSDVPCVGDVDGDGDVGIGDLLAIVDHWGRSSTQYDIDESGTVDGSDLLLIISNWGNCD